MNEEDIKPKNLKLHDFLIRKTGVKLMIDETIVDKVISHEKKGINQALKQYCEVEISGFGKLYLSSKKLHRRLEQQVRIIGFLEAKLLREDIDIETFTRNMKIAKDDLEYYKTVLERYENRYQGNSRGSKELILPSEGVEGTDRADSSL